MSNESPNLMATFADLTSFINNTLLTKSTGIQLVFVLLALLIGYAVRHLIVRTTCQLIKEDMDKGFTKSLAPYQSQIGELQAVLWPLISGGLLWAAHTFLPGNLPPFPNEHVI